MKDIQQPKKQPDLIRKRIIEQAIVLASEKGISGVSIQSVANGAGISKGGVFHHFSNKQILIEEMMHAVILHLDAVIEEMIQQDQGQHGKFTRAYIHSSFISEIDGLISPWSAVAMTMITDKTFNTIWGQWFNQKLDQYATTDDDSELELIRLATDGLWLQSITGMLDEATCLKMKNNLIDRTYLEK